MEKAEAVSKSIEPVVVRGCTWNSLLKVEEIGKQNARERSPFKLTGIALVTRMDAFAGITGVELVDSEMPKSWTTISCTQVHNHSAAGTARS
jgi:hypothetical protein